MRRFLITDRLLTLLQGCSWTFPAGLSLYITQSWVALGGLKGGRGCPEEHWGKTLMLTETGREARDRRKRARANGPGKANSSRELHPYSGGGCAVSKVDLLGM